MMEKDNDSTQTCDNCHHTCLTCTCKGRTYNDCKSCDPADHLWLRKDLNTCVEDCEDLKYKRPATQPCEACDSSYECCEGASNSKCTCCNEKTYLYNGNCGACPSVYYGGVADWTCKECDSTCCESSGPEAT